MRREQTEPLPLLNARGELNAPGWARTPVWTYRRRAVGSALRLREWDRLIVTDGRRALGVTLEDDTYLGSLTVWTLDLETGAQRSARRQTPLTLSSTGLSEEPFGSSAASGEGWAAALLNSGTRMALSLHLDGFRERDALDVHLTMPVPGGDVMAAAFPFLKKDRFYYTCKSCGIRAAGTMILGGERYEFGADCAASLDWSRGVLPYRSTAWWGAAWGEAEGKRLALNLGYGISPAREPSENGIFVDGKLRKLDRVAFRIPQKNGREDLTGKWLAVSADRRLEAEFTPDRQREERWNLVVARNEADQLFGHWSGTVIGKDGSRLSFRDLPGFLERRERRG